MYESLRQDISGIRVELKNVRTEIAGLREHMAKLEGLFEGYVRGDYKAPTPS